MKRGQVWWAEMEAPRGSEPGYRRPVLIVQDDLLTRSHLATVMVVPLTTNLNRATALGNVALSKRDTGLKKDSVAQVCQVHTIDKDYLTELVGGVPRRKMEAVDDGLRLALDLW